MSLFYLGCVKNLFLYIKLQKWYEVNKLFIKFNNICLVVNFARVEGKECYWFQNNLTAFKINFKFIASLKVVFYHKNDNFLL